jgi:ribosomal protein S14
MADTNSATAAPSCPARGPKPCLLCGRPGVIESLYFPGPNSPAAPPPGKGRIIRYRLCETCGRQRQSLLEIIEARIESDLRSSGLI